MGSAKEKRKVSHPKSAAHREIQELIHPWLEGIEDRERNTDLIDVHNLIRDLGSRWPSLSEDLSRHLEKLGRKVDIAKRLDAFYKPGWRRAENPGTLSPSAIYLLSAVFLAEAQKKLSQSETRGLSLKALNSAFHCLDLVEGVKFDGNVAPLRKWAEELCQRAKN